MSRKRNMFKRRQGAFMRMLSLSVPVPCTVLMAPAISEAATTGTVTGVVNAARLDANNQPVLDAQGNLQVGAPQRGANVRLVPIGGGAAPRSTVTGPDGRYTFTGVQPGSYNVVVSLVTFEEFTTPVEVTQDIVRTVNAVLTPTVVQVQGEIEIQTVRPAQTTTTTEISARQEQLVRSTPTQLYQTNGLIFGLPGITPDPEGYTHIRGGDTNQVGFQIDGIDITDPLTGTFGTNLVTIGLKNANLYTGGANASYGGKTAGFINQVTQNGRDIRGGIFEYTGAPGYGHDYQGTNIQYGNVFGKLDFYGTFIGFRNDFPESTSVQSLNDSADGLLKFNYYASPNDTITAYHSQGFEQYDYYQPRADFPEANLKYEDRELRARTQGAYQQDHNTQGNQISYLTYRRNFSPTSFATLRTYRFYTFVNFHLENTGAQYQRRTSTQNGYQLNYENQLTPQYRLQAGLEYIPTTRANFEVVAGFAGNGDWADPSFTSNAGYTHYLSRVKPKQTAAYLTNQFRLFDERLTLDLGVRHAQMRFDRVKFADFTRNYTDPRIGVTVNPAQNTVFRGSFYRNSQFPDAFRTERLFPEDLGFATARRPGDPNLPPGILERGLLLRLRFELDHYVNLRPAILHPGVSSPLRDPGPIDFVVVREGTEGPYVGNGGALRVDTPAEIATEVSVNTAFGVERVVRDAFARAEARPRHKLTLVHKNNVLVHAGSLWARTVARVAEEHRDIGVDYLHVDAATIFMVTDPGRFDVIVTDNLFGDILTDLAAAVTGGIGLAASGNVNPDRTAPSMFEPVHGSAPDIAGQGKADPTAAILSAAMMLTHLGLPEAAARLEAAVAADLAERGDRVRSTDQVGEDILARVGDRERTAR